ncbi:MAG TPA: radical SAM protein [Nanoarchaeota archaeon]|nr:radical SAM protein [Nanoarchaeota archaeon]
MVNKFTCKICGKESFSAILPCPKCAKTEKALEIARILHKDIEKLETNDFIAKCSICSNNCKLKNNEFGLCKIRFAENGKIKSLASEEKALLHYYLDPLPTNCCNSWFCKCSKIKGYNLALFYYACNFSCLFCQNYEHKNIEHAKITYLNELLEVLKRKEIKCICHFGGSPEPQIEFALNLSKKALEKRKDIVICWEWNGAGNEKLALKAAELSFESKGTVKFDLKAWNENLHILLTGRSNKQVLKNFENIFSKFPEVISATTLLVPYYVDQQEVESIAKFIASFSENIPYSLLVFYPAYKLKDMPITPKSQVFACYKAARKHLKNVHIGNLHLLFSRY